MINKRLVATPPKRGLNRGKGRGESSNTSPTKRSPHRILRKSTSQTRFDLLDAKLMESSSSVTTIDKKKQKAKTAGSTDFIQIISKIKANHPALLGRFLTSFFCSLASCSGLCL